MAAILNRRFTASITYHNFFRGFRAGCGTDTSTLEEKNLQKLAAMREEFLHLVFLELHKAYVDLDRDICL